MAIVGNNRRIYITNAAGSTHTVVKGEQSNSFNRSMSPIEVTDKDTVWQEFLAGKRGATADVTLNLDNTSTEQQHAFVQALHAGSTVLCFIGQVASGGGSRTEGDAFTALVTAVNDTSEQEAVASRQISLQVTGEVTHVPSTAPAQND